MVDLEGLTVKEAVRRVAKLVDQHVEAVPTSSTYDNNQVLRGATGA